MNVPGWSRPSISVRVRATIAATASGESRSADAAAANGPNSGPAFPPRSFCHASTAFCASSPRTVQRSASGPLRSSRIFSSSLAARTSSKFSAASWLSVAFKSLCSR